MIIFSENRLTTASLSYAAKLALLGLLTLFTQQAAIAQQNTLYSLNVTPQQCVAMRQGQDCYVDVEIQWTAPKRGHYCLHRSGQSTPLQCWQQATTATYKQELVINSNVSFSLQHHGANHILATNLIEMAWVYNKNTRANVSWRMF